MRRSRTSTRLAPLLFAAFLISATITSLPAPVRAEAEAEQLSEEEIAEAAVLADEAGEAEADAEEEIEEEYVDEKDVLVLTDGNFSDAIKTHPFILVEFYAPWCGHCQALKPQYAKAATELKEAGLTVALGKVDATAEPSLGQKYAVQGYPTLKWFVDGEALDYGGGRTAEDIIKWIKKKTGPPATTVGSTAELEKVSGSVKTFALGYFSTLGSDGHKAFEDAARSADDIEFLQTTDAAVAKAAGLTAEGIVVSRTFEDEREVSVYSGVLEKDAIRDFVKAEKVPPYVIFSEENQDLIFNSGIPLNVIIIGSAEQLAKGSAVTKAARAAHSKTKGDVIFVLADRTGESAEPILEFFGLPRESEEPQVVGFHMESSQRYKFSEALSDATLTAFAEGIVAGTVEPSYKSEEVPTGDDAKDGDVVVVVGKNFDEIVLDEKRDVLLEAYAPWCGHCKQLAPTYRKLAKRFRDVDSVVIAKIEGTANEHKLLKVEGFPTILLFPAGKDQTPIPYEGDERTLKALTQFVKKSAKVDFTLPKKQKETEEQEDKEDEEAQKAAEAEAEEETPEGEDGGLPNDDDTQEIQLGDEDLVDGFEDLGDDVSEEEAAEAAAAAEEAVDAAEDASSEKDEL